MALEENFNLRFLYLIVFTIVFAIYNVVHASSLKIILEKASFNKKK
jgi:hypothetical protein